MPAVYNKYSKTIEWLDFEFAPNQDIPDKEFIGIEFLENYLNPKDFNALKSSWTKFWPSTRNAQNWDAIGRMGNQWLLVEAKANENEILSNCSASDDSQLFIKDRFAEIKTGYGITTKNSWLNNYYQKANRILFLEFLRTNNIDAKLLFVYFINGFNKNGKQLGVATDAEWKKIIAKQDKYLGITSCPAIKKDIVNLIIDIDK